MRSLVPVVVAGHCESELNQANARDAQWPLPAPDAVVVVAPIIAWQPDEQSADAEHPVGDLKGLGQSLFGDYLFAVELAGTLLLVASIGAIAIAPRREQGAI